MVDKEVAGYSKRLGGLEFVVVLNSGHLVPFNQPVVALNLIARFVQGKSFSDMSLPSFSHLLDKSTQHHDHPNDDESTHRKSIAAWLGKVVVGLFLVGIGFLAGIAKSKFNQRQTYQPVLSIET